MNMLVSGIALLLACSALLTYDRYTFRTNLVSRLAAEGNIIGSNTVSALVFNDPRAAESTLSALAASPNILYAAIYTPNRRCFAEYLRDSKVNPLPMLAIPAGQSQADWFQDGQIALVRPIVFQGRPIGYVYIRSDLQAINRRLRGYAFIALGVLVTSLLAALLISKMAQRAIAGPISHLAAIARAVSVEKDYSIRVASTAQHDEVSTLIEAFNEMLVEIQRRDRSLSDARDELEKRVQERTTQLAATNQELEAFCYSVAHDLRAPLRGIDGFSQALLEDYEDKLDSSGKDYLRRVRAASQRMSVLIDDLLNLSRVTRVEMQKEKLNLSAIVESVASDLQMSEPGRGVEFVIEEDLLAIGDSRLLRVAVENLLGNAWKYTSRHGNARIEFGGAQRDGQPVYFVRDDGAGFDPRHAARLFGAFQRLHSNSEFPGTGIGLATVQRIVHRHGGDIWADAAIEQGATFSFTLQGQNGFCSKNRDQYKNGDQ
jgi:signal transduction histidine kinase